MELKENGLYKINKGKVPYVVSTWVKSRRIYHLLTSGEEVATYIKLTTQNYCYKPCSIRIENDVLVFLKVSFQPSLVKTVHYSFIHNGEKIRITSHDLEPESSFVEVE